MFTYLATLKGATGVAMVLFLILLVAGVTHGLFKLADRLARDRRTDDRRPEPKRR